MKSITELIKIMTEVYDEGNYENLDKSTAEQVCMYLEMLHDLMHDTAHYAKTYEDWNGERYD